MRARGNPYQQDAEKAQNCRRTVEKDELLLAAGLFTDDGLTLNPFGEKKRINSKCQSTVYDQDEKPLGKSHVHTSGVIVDTTLVLGTLDESGQWYF